MSYEVASLTREKIKEQIGKKVVVLKNGLLSCKTILGITNSGNIIFDDWDEISKEDYAMIYRFDPVRDLLLDKE